MKYLVVSLLTLTFTCQTLATSKEEVKEKTVEAAVAVADYSKEQKEQFQKEMEVKLEDLNVEIKALKAKVSETSGDAKKEMKEQISSLESKQAEMKKDLAKLKKSSGKAWSEMKSGVSKAWNVLSDSYQKAKAEFKETK